MSIDDELQSDFTCRPAIPYEEGVTRRDPSPVIRVGDLYHVWYSKSITDSSGYAATVWWATSPDGLKWTERGRAIGKGPDDAWDAHGVFTPTILVAEGRYWLYYTAVPKPFTNRGPDGEPTPTAIGVASADRPEGPWTKFKGNPVLRPGPDGDFDSCRVDDACFIVRDGEYRMYYKGRERRKTPGQTKMGLATAESPTGPFTRRPDNPLIDSGHEVCVWPHGDGVAALVAPTGPQGATTQYSPDGIRFQRVADVSPPHAPGPYREDDYRDVDFGPGIRWGLCIHNDPSWPSLDRFDCDLTAQP